MTERGSIRNTGVIIGVSAGPAIEIEITPVGGGEPLTLADLADIGNAATGGDLEPFLANRDGELFRRGKKAATEAIIMALLGLRELVP